jgi:hypothetical protein
LTYFSGDKSSVSKISISLGSVLSKTALYTSVGSYLALKGGSRYGCLLLRCYDTMWSWYDCMLLCFWISYILFIFIIITKKYKKNSMNENDDFKNKIINNILRNKVKYKINKNWFGQKVNNNNFGMFGFK